MLRSKLVKFTSQKIKFASFIVCIYHSGIEGLMFKDKSIKNKIHISPFLLSIISFFLVIFVGAFFICTPMAQTTGQWGDFVDALFTATSATCVTGLVSLKGGVVNDLTFFGQLIVIICIQVGGLSFITILAFIITLFKKKLQFKDRFSLSQIVGAESMNQLAKFVRKVILIAFCFEFAGFLLSLPAFLTIYQNPWDAIWASIFHSISSYNNAGFDMFSTTSFVRETALEGSLLLMMPEWAYQYLCIITMLLIVCGGISFVVVIEVFTFKNPKQYTVFTKIVLIMTTILIFGGAGLFMLTDGMKGENSMDFMQALFQSVTLRTAGFASYDQASLSVAGKILSCLLMFIGAAPLSTGGGIKVTTAFLIVLTMYSYLRGKRVIAFKRFFSQKTILKGLSLTFLAFGVVILSYVICASIEANNPNYDQNRLTDLLYESFSAFGTVGVSTGITPTLHPASKIVLSIVMFIGRLGPITFFQVFNSKDSQQDANIHYVETDILIG